MRPKARQNEGNKKPIALGATGLSFIRICGHKNPPCISPLGDCMRFYMLSVSV